MYFHQLRTIILLLIVIYTFSNFVSAHAQFQSPDNVTVIMYQLASDGSIIKDRDNHPIPCKKDDTFYGCTAMPDNATYAYPFASSTITISIDGSNGPDNDVYVYPYLWDVTPQELDMNGSQGNKPLAAVKAQMIAARTYIYQRLTYIDQYGTPNNSTQFHVFLPYRYQALTPPQRVRVQAAALERLYLSEANSTYPLEALYGADNPGATVTGNRPYLQSVLDPISAAYGVLNGTGNGGMSSKGISRWAFGHTSSRGPVAVGQPTYPHDDGGNGDFWPVRLDDAAQLLTHYYTGIHLRDATANNTIVTPARRWAALQIRWDTADGNPPAARCAGNAIPLTGWVQNTGTTTWASGGAVHFGYQELPGLQVQSAAVTAAAYPLAPGAPGGAYTATLLYVAPTDMADEDIANPRVEMFEGNTPFSQFEAGHSWPTYLVQIPIHICDKRGYLPMIQRGRVTSIQAQSNRQAVIHPFDHPLWLPLIAR